MNKDLLNSLDSWLPRRLIELDVNHNYTNKRSEGFFGSFKGKYGFNRVSLSELVKRLVNFLHIFFINSPKNIIKTQKYYETFPCFNSYNLKKCGKLILSSLSDEYDACMNELNNYPYCVWCQLKDKSSPYTIPCRHIMHDTGNSLFSIDEIHPRYINEMDHQMPENNQVQVSFVEDEKLQTFTDIMSEISPDTSIAPKNEKVMSVFTRTINDLHSIEKSITTGMPPTIEQSGRFPTETNDYSII